MTSIDIMARRSRVFELWAQGLKPSDIQRIVSEEHDISERTVREDLRTMKAWLPEIVNMQATSDEHAAKILATARLIRQRLMNIGETSTNAPMKVGAYSRSLAALKFEVEFLQSTGKVDKIPDKLEADVKGDLKFILEAWRPEVEEKGEESDAE